MIFLPRVLSFLILALCAISTIALAQEHTPLEIPEALSANSVGNMEYRCGLNHGLTIPLRNGLYSAEVPYLPQRPLTMSANLAALAHGDLDADSTPDAAVVYIYNTGGTGQYYMLSILQAVAGAPKESACLYLGDRVQLQDLTIDKGRVRLDMVTHRKNDPVCCPEKRETWYFVLRDGHLELAPDK